MGDTAAKAIVKEREQNGPYKSFIDFLERILLIKEDLTEEEKKENKTPKLAINKKAIEVLIKTGGFDNLDKNRPTLLANLDRAFEYTEKKLSVNNYGQVSLFEDTDEKEFSDFIFEEQNDCSKLEKLNMEKELIGCYISGHPLDDFKKGDVVVVTEKRYYKGQVLVYNKKGELIFAWGSGSYSILDAAISPKRKVAISLLNTDTGANSLIYCMDVNGKEKYKTGNFKNSVIFELEFSGENLNAIADNRCIGISAKGKTQWEHSFGDKTLTNMDIAANGTKLFLLEKDGMGLDNYDFLEMHNNYGKYYSFCEV